MPNLLACALVAFDEPTLDVNDVECMCVSLIDQVCPSLSSPHTLKCTLGLSERLHPAFIRFPRVAEGSASIWFPARIECGTRISI